SGLASTWERGAAGGEGVELGPRPRRRPPRASLDVERGAAGEGVAGAEAGIARDVGRRPRGPVPRPVRVIAEYVRGVRGSSFPASRYHLFAGGRVARPRTQGVEVERLVLVAVELGRALVSAST